MSLKNYIFVCMFCLLTINVWALPNNWKLQLEGPETIVLHNKVDYTIHLFYQGKTVAKEVHIQYRWANNFSFTNCTLSGLIPSTTGYKDHAAWKFFDVQPQSEIKIQIQLRAMAIGSGSNELSIKDENKQQKSAIDFSVKGVAALHVSSYDTEDPIAADNNTIYVIGVRNEGTSNCSDLSLVDYIPKGTKFVFAKGPSPYKFVEGKVFFAPVEVLAPGEKLSYKICVQIITSGILKNTAIIRGKEFSKPIVSEEVTCVGGINTPALHISSYETEDPVKVGSETTYVVEVRNEGRASCTGIIITNSISDKTKLVSATGDYKQQGNKIIFAPLKSLEPGNKATYKITVIATSPGTSINTTALKSDFFKKEVREQESTSIYR